MVLFPPSVLTALSLVTYFAFIECAMSFDSVLLVESCLLNIISLNFV